MVCFQCLNRLIAFASQPFLADACGVIASRDQFFDDLVALGHVVCPSFSAVAVFGCLDAVHGDAFQFAGLQMPSSIRRCAVRPNQPCSCHARPESIRNCQASMTWSCESASMKPSAIPVAVYESMMLSFRVS